MDLSAGSPLAIVVGLLLALLGATGATAVARGFDTSAQPARVPLRLVPFGILIGGGAALVRGWDLGVGVLVGAVVIPVVATVFRLIEVRRRRWRGRPRT